MNNTHVPHHDRPNLPPLDWPEAVRIATERMRAFYVLPETADQPHPANPALPLAMLLTASGKLPAEADRLHALADERLANAPPPRRARDGSRKTPPRLAGGIILEIAETAEPTGSIHARDAPEAKDGLPALKYRRGQD